MIVILKTVVVLVGSYLIGSIVTSDVVNLFKKEDADPPEPDTLTVSIRYLVDPFGYAYGYSTKGTFNPKNVSFDLWSAAGTTDKTTTDQLKWVKNW